MFFIYLPFIYRFPKSSIVVDGTIVAVFLLLALTNHSPPVREAAVHTFKDFVKIAKKNEPLTSLLDHLSLRTSEISADRE